MEIGAIYQGNGVCQFRIWAPLKKKVFLHIIHPREKKIALDCDHQGYWTTQLNDIKPGTEYYYQLDHEQELPDPASRFQPQGVHGPSQVVDYRSFLTHPGQWKCPDLKQLFFYELHIGTFTAEGTFKALINQLDHLVELGINAIEIMPIAQFPGSRNWGYDGVYAYAVQQSYGNPAQFKAMIDACHERGLAVFLDVVYNHLGPEGNYLNQFAPYFSHRYMTPWGKAINFDGEYSDHVRNYYLENALYWLNYYNIDGLRLDATHEIFDMGANHFLKQLAEQVQLLEQQKGRKFYLIAENDSNDPIIIKSIARGGRGLSGQWCDDFHHSLHSLLTGECNGFYSDYSHQDALLQSYRQAYVLTGQYSHYRKRKIGASAQHLPCERFVVFSQNHDMVGNRMLGERLCHLLSFEAAKVAAALTILSPYLPLLFMGEEFAVETPFLYFVSHQDQNLIKAVQKGRQEEFKKFNWDQCPPDPQAEKTFNQSKINWQTKNKPRSRALFHFYQTLIQLRKENRALSELKHENCSVNWVTDQVMSIKRCSNSQTMLSLVNFKQEKIEINLPLPGQWKCRLNSAAQIWQGPALEQSLCFQDQIKLSLEKENYILLENKA